jgi:membrane fusion protein (multidrug efflux system)
MRLQQQLADGKLARDAQGAVVQVVMEDGSIYPLAGHLLFTDLSVDPGTGQVLLRATVPNPRHNLLPGLFVRARLTQAQIDNAILLQQQAVTRSGAGDMAMVVNADGTVAPRPLKISGQQGANWIVTGGLKPGEQVMVEGISKMMMGAKTVKPVPWQGGAAAPAGAGAPPPAAAGKPAASAPAPAASH